MDELIQRLGPVGTIVVAILMVILGILVIAEPQVLRWIVGIMLVLAGTALIASIAAPEKARVARQ